MALSTSALTTRQRYKDFAGVTANDATTNSLIDNLINSASEWVEGYCQRIFGRQTYTNQLYDGTGDYRLVLKYFPVISTSTFKLEIRNSGINEDDWSTIDSEYYFVDYNTGIMSFPKSQLGVTGRQFVRGSANYRVTYTAGWYLPQDASWVEGASTALPTELEFITWKLVNNYYDNRTGGDNVTSERLGAYAVSYAKTAFENEMAMTILDKYSRSDFTY